MCLPLQLLAHVCFGLRSPATSPPLGQEVATASLGSRIVIALDHWHKVGGILALEHGATIAAVGLSHATLLETGTGRRLNVLVDAGARKRSAFRGALAGCPR